MDLGQYAQRLNEIAKRRQGRMTEATSNYITEMRNIVTESEVDTQMATTEMLGDEVSPIEESPKEIARGLFG